MNTNFINYSDDPIILDTIARDGICSNINLIRTIRGTDKIKPAIPHTNPQNTNPKSTVSKFNLNLPPITKGSTTLPMISFNEISIIAKVDTGDNESYWIAAINIGGIAAIMGPIVGIKVNKKVIKPQKNAKLIP